MYNDIGMIPMRLYLSNNTPKYMSDFINYAACYLGLDKLRGEINITYKTSLEEEAYGLCWGDRHECEIHIGSRSFGAKITRENKLKTIAHELTHAHQYLTGKLKCDPEPEDLDNEWASVWEGERLAYKRDEETEQPWEREAVYFENEVYYCYLEDKSLYQ